MKKIKMTENQQAEVSLDVVPSVYCEEKALSKNPRRKSKNHMEEVSRGSNYRTFKKEDGSYRAKIYNQPINYFDERSKSYQRYENQLIKTKRMDGEMNYDGYENAAGDFCVRFAEHISDGVIFTVKKGKYYLALLPYEQAMSQAEIIYNDNMQKLLFKNYVKGVDLEYKLSESKIKENILVQGRTPEHKFKFNLRMRNLKMTIGENGRVLNFVEETGDRIVFKIPAPSMSDAAGIVSEEVYYEITERTEHEYELQVIADRAWLNEANRAYPVTIDPTIVNYDKHYIETYKLLEEAGELDKNTNTVDTNYQGNNRYSSKIWVRFTLDEAIPKNAVVRSAVMHMRKNAYYLNGTRTSDIALLQVVNDLAEEGSFIGKLRDTIYTDIIGTDIKETYEAFTVDVTETVRDPEKRGKGLLFEMADSEADNQTFLVFSAFMDDPKYKPNLDVDYYVPEEYSGGEKYTVSVNEKCSYALNMYTGTELVEFQDVSMSGNRLPLKISHIYNSLHKSKNYYTVGGSKKETGMPAGWKLNVQQYLYSEGEGSEQRYVYIDQAGFRHKLYRYIKVEATPSGTTYTFNTDNYEFRNDSIGMKYIGSNKLMDNGGTVYSFGGGILTKITDRNGNTMQITYGNDDECNYVLKSITDGCGRKANLQYEAGCLKRITLPDGTAVNYSVNGTTEKTLDSVVYAEGTAVQFTYRTHNVSTIADNAGYRLHITGDGTQYTFQDETTVNTINGAGIEKLSEINEENEINTQNRVHINDGYTVIEYENGTKTYCKFDSDGVCVNKFALSADNTPRVLAFNGTRIDDNEWYRFSSMPGAENKLGEGMDKWHCPANGGQMVYGYELIGKAGQQTFMQREISGNNMFELRDDEGMAVAALVETDKYCLNPSEESEAKFELNVTLTYQNPAKNKERVYRYDGRIKNEYQMGVVPLTKDDLEGLEKINVRIEYSKCYNGGKNNMSAGYELPQSTLKIRHVELVRCKINKTVIAPSFFNGSECYGAKEINRVYYGSESYTVVAEDAETMQTFANDVAGMLSNAGKIYKDGEVIKSNVDPATIKLSGTVKTSETSRYFNDNLFSLEYAPRGYTETKSAAGTSRSWCDAQGMLRRSGFINPNGEEYHAFYYYDIHGNLVKVQDEKQGDKTEYDYNSHGTVIKETVGNKRSNDKLIYESQTDTSGDYTVKEYDGRYSDEACNTIYTQSAYNSYKGRLSKVTMPNGQAYHYGYDNGGMLDSVSAGFATRSGNHVNHIQNENIQYEYRVGLLTKINRTDAVYEFEYDGYSRVKKVTLNGVTVYTAAYHKTSDGKSYTGASYGNGWNGEEITDEQGRFVEKSVTKDSFKQAIASAEYDENTTLLKSLTDSACGSGKTTKTAYGYNEHGEVTSVQYTGYRNGAYTQETDSEGYVTKTTYEKNVGETQEYRYLYEKHGGTEGNRVPNAALTCLYLPADTKVKYVYDSLNRLAEKQVVTEKDEYYSELYRYENGGYQEHTIYNRFLKNNISPFCVGGGCGGGSSGGEEPKPPVPPVTVIRPDRTTTFVSEVQFRGLNLTDKYEYDKNGNISKRMTGGKEIRYTYDDIDRLIREDNAALSKTYFYEYDDFGNIEKVAAYSYTTGNSLTGGAERTYSYDSSKRLISVTDSGATQFVGGYDALGNPSSYKGRALTWTRGRMLASCGSDSYLYDMHGVRQEKTVNGVTHTYYTDGTKIIAEKVGDKVFEYYYDAQGVIGFKYDGYVYYYKKNLLGDIDRIYDADKNLVAQYQYDAWGNHKIYGIKNGESIDITNDISYNNSIAKLNRFRYRGYYYDTETGLYYLNSRYYDPSVGRFINADDISYIQPTHINGLNLFAYCLNNPIMYTDPTGQFVLSSLLMGLGIAALIGAGVGALSYAGSVVVSGVLTGEWNWSGGMFVGSILGGAIGGVFSFALPGIVPMLSTTASLMISAGVTGFASNVIGMSLQNAFGEADHGYWQILGTSALVGGISTITAGLTSKIKIPGLTGRGSISQVARQISTKFYNGTIGKIVMKTFGKMVAYEAFYSVFSTIAGGVIDAWQYYNRPKLNLLIGPLY